MAIEEKDQVAVEETPVTEVKEEQLVEEQSTESEAGESADESKKIEDDAIEVYEYGDASIYCHSCGKETPVNHPGFVNVKGGVNIPLTVNSKSHITLSCNNCSSILSLHFVPAVNPPVQDAEEVVENTETSDEGLQEDSKKEGTV